MQLPETAQWIDGATARRSTRIETDVLIEVQGEDFAYAGETVRVSLHGSANPDVRTLATRHACHGICPPYGKVSGCANRIGSRGEWFPLWNRARPTGQYLGRLCHSFRLESVLTSETDRSTATPSV
jgi:hypothetical protein